MQGNFVVANNRLIEWGVAACALPGQTVSGDLHLVKPITGGVLLAAVDGVGHGEEATAAAEIAIGILNQHAGELLDRLVMRCHAALTKTRGVAMTVATLLATEERLTWLGVGNVEAALLHAGEGGSERVLLRSGLVGYQLPELRASTTAIAPRDLLVFATDGIGPNFADNLHQSGPPQQIADRVLDCHFKRHDDALVLVARYLGSLL
jgi:hypothetical protein